MKLLLPLAFVVCCAPAWAQNPVSVRVLDGDKKPIAGALVVAQVYTREAPKLVPQTTDATGNATFSLPNGEDGQLTTVRFVAGAQGYSFNSAASADGKAQIRLRRGQTWRGKVVDDKGAPLAGARIVVYGAMKGQDFSSAVSFGGSALTDLYSAQSKADGSFETPNLPTDKELSYSVTAPLFASVQGEGARADVEKLVKLIPSGSVGGQALAVAGKPLANIRVYARPARGNGSNSATTDAEGTFLIENLVL